MMPYSRCWRLCFLGKPTLPSCEPSHGDNVRHRVLQRYNAAMTDNPGQVATGRDTAYSLNVEEAATLYARAGHPRTLRTVQRYCASGHLDCVKEATMLGDKYFIEPSSVARHISQIEELIALDTRASRRDTSRPVATAVAAENRNAHDPLPHATEHDMSWPVAQEQSLEHHTNTVGDGVRQNPTHPTAVSRPVATDELETSRYVVGLEREVERALEDRDFLREQIKTKDKQIDALLERDRETNILVRGLQQMLSPLLGPARREPPEEGSHPHF